MSTDDNAGLPQGQKIVLPGESFRSIRIEMVASPTGPDTGAEVGRNLTGMAHGTAFIYRLDGKDHLVTARHNVTGRHWETKEPIGEHSDSPTHLRMLLMAKPPEQWRLSSSAESPRMANLQVLFGQHLLPLVGEDWQPIWKQHPILGPDMDVAVVPFNPPADAAIMPWEPGPQRTAPDTAPWPHLTAGQDVFIIGYPYRITVGPLLPLWIRGTVASEPAFGYDANDKSYPLWLIDARTRKGQSGAPVIRHRPPGTFVIRNDGQPGVVRNSDSELLGVYSGRTSEESDIGFVWPMTEVTEICLGGVQGTIF